jgi:hypothetical protein
MRSVKPLIAAIWIARSRSDSCRGTIEGTGARTASIIVEGAISLEGCAGIGWCRRQFGPRQTG